MSHTGGGRQTGKSCTQEAIIFHLRGIIQLDLTKESRFTCKYQVTVLSHYKQSLRGITTS